jgi:hypothetical protein
MTVLGLVYSYRERSIEIPEMEDLKKQVRVQQEHKWDALEELKHKANFMKIFVEFINFCKHLVT